MSQSSPIMPNQRSSVEGVAPPLTTAAERLAALDLAFDYRGDVTIRTTDGRVLEGYIFDRRRDGAQPCIRLLPKDGSPRATIRDDEVASLVFSGRDPAAGKSWETWLAKYMDKKARGEKANLESEPLE